MTTIPLMTIALLLIKLLTHQDPLRSLLAHFLILTFIHRCQNLLIFFPHSIRWMTKLLLKLLTSHCSTRHPILEHLINHGPLLRHFTHFLPTISFLAILTFLLLFAHIFYSIQIHFFPILFQRFKLLFSQLLKHVLLPWA